MRAILLILILAVVILIAAIASGFVEISQTRPGEVPRIESSDGTIRAREGQAPAFDVDTGSVEVGTTTTNVAVPRVEVSRDQAKVPVPRVEVKSPGEEPANAN